MNHQVLVGGSLQEMLTKPPLIIEFSLGKTIR